MVIDWTQVGISDPRLDLAGVRRLASVFVSIEYEPTVMDMRPDPVESMKGSTCAHKSA